MQRPRGSSPPCRPARRSRCSTNVTAADRVDAKCHDARRWSAYGREGWRSVGTLSSRSVLRVHVAHDERGLQTRPTRSRGESVLAPFRGDSRAAGLAESKGTRHGGDWPVL
ncbi:hypothetical protein FGB62_59g028 [Gracilaria domingensis]|nr:hypothetical protein FGB62_59g028 [Gracilaria domingensis]